LASVENLKRELQTLIERTNEALKKVESETAADAVFVAAQTHRLDLVTVSIAVLGILVGGFGLLGFFEIRSRAKRAAIKAAKQTCKPIAEQIVNDYISNELPDEVREHVEILIQTQQEGADYGQQDTNTVTS